MNTNVAGEVCLVIVFNHRYEDNLGALDALYGERFPNRLYLMPFYRGDRPDVIRVHESSYCFQGYFAQAHAALGRRRFRHYIFCGDDLILHPELNEQNIARALGLSSQAAFIKSFASLADGAEAWPGLPTFRWEYAMPALVTLVDKRGVAWRQELPSYDEAVRRFQEKGVEPGSLQWKQLRSGWQVRSLFLFLFYFYKRLQWQRRHTGKAEEGPASLSAFPYPLAKGYVDLFILPGSVLDRFCHVCGVLAAMGLFVEIAIPTALLLCCDEVVQEAQTRWHGLELWDHGDIERFGQSHQFQLGQLAAGFSPDQLYVHPVKLSRWKA